MNPARTSQIVESSEARSPTAGSPADLATEIALLRRAARGASNDIERASLQQRARGLTAELRRMVGGRREGAPASPLEAARAALEVTRFDVPASHRPRLGPLVTASKRWALRLSAPLQRELLARQSDFNRELFAALEACFAPTTAAPNNLPGTLWDAAERAADERRLREILTGPRKLRSTYAHLASKTLRSAWSRQRTWNQSALELLELAHAKTLLPPIEARRRIDDLFKSGDPFDGPAPLPQRLLGPLWRELFRNQVRFNREVTLVLARALGTHPPPSDPPAETYRTFLARTEPAQIDQARRALRSIGRTPLISVVVPAYQTAPRILKACIDSVRRQLYSNWELCVVDDASPGSAVARVLQRAAAKDPRVRWVRLAANKGIAGATNAALEMAKGEWIVFMDHDDLLAPHALAEVALAIDEDPALDWLYSDEDMISPEGQRHRPRLKGDWSADLLRSTNYICHLVAVRATLAKSLRLREGFEGSQDHDFLLRLSEQTERVRHLQKILYHWRELPQSFSRNLRGLKTASHSGVRAVREHLARLGEAAEVWDPWPSQYRVRYEVKGQPLVSVIVPFKDRPELLERLVKSLLDVTRYPRFELLLVSNDSREEKTRALLKGFSDTRIRVLEWNHPFRYPAINNFGARHARGDLLLFLNNDMEVVDPLWLHELIGQAQRPVVGAVGPKLLFPDGTLQHAGLVVGLGGAAGHPHWGFPDSMRWSPLGHADWARNWLAVTSACVMTRREVFEALGGFDEAFALCGSDVDLCLRVWKLGLRVVYTPGTFLYHHESASRGSDAIPIDDQWESFLAYREILEGGGDPFYNPHLSVDSTDCALNLTGETALEATLRRLAGA